MGFFDFLWNSCDKYTLQHCIDSRCLVKFLKFILNSRIHISGFVCDTFQYGNLAIIIQIQTSRNFLFGMQAFCMIHNTRDVYVLFSRGACNIYHFSSRCPIYSRYACRSIVIFFCRPSLAYSNEDSARFQIHSLFLLNKVGIGEWIGNREPTQRKIPEPGLLCM